MERSPGGMDQKPYSVSRRFQRERFGFFILPCFSKTLRDRDRRVRLRYFPNQAADDAVLAPSPIEAASHRIHRGSHRSVRGFHEASLRREAAPENAPSTFFAARSRTVLNFSSRSACWFGDASASRSFRKKIEHRFACLLLRSVPGSPRFEL